MNIIEAVRVFRSNEAPASKVKKYNDAVQSMDAIVAQYDALAPTPEMWEQAPSWVQWYAINSDGDGRFREKEPTIFNEESRWYGIPLEGHIDSVLPLGIDWRLCKWQRPEAAG